jgi:8-oxo-dGTP pyrophosphatase MutT (NUDIX family)
VNFDVAIERLRWAFTRPLPGAGAQAFMAPEPRRDWPKGFNQDKIRSAAGLLLLFPVDGEAHIVLTVRSGALGRHGGQVSLPGGVTDPDETFETAALREAHEEVALSTAEVTVLGALTPIDIPVSGFRLHPIVASMTTRPTLVPSDGEVAQILEVSVSELFEPARRIRTLRVRDGREIVVPAFQIAGTEIWGATAMVLSEFLVLVGWSG